MADFRCGASRSLPLNTTRSWDGGAASGRMLDAAGIGGDSPDFAAARKGFLIYDGEKPELRGSYHLPFADMVDGTKTALISGCRAAASRLPQMDGLSDALQQRARGVLDHYFAMNEEKGRMDAPDVSLWSVPAAIRRISAGDSRAAGSASVGDLLALAQKRALDPTVFDDHPPVFIEALISNNRLDSYFTRMHRSTLENFAADAEMGVGVQNSHNTRALSLGRSLTGRFIGGQGSGVQRVVSDFYMVPGLKLNEVSTDDAIAGIRAGILADVSVGFYGGTEECSVCGLSLWDWDCMHIPGMAYATKEGAEPQMAIGWIKDAHLSEYSIVYDGACPGAEILGMKAAREADAGRMPADTARQLMSRFRISLPSHAARHYWPGADLPPPEHRQKEDAMDPEKDQQETPNVVESEAPEVSPESTAAGTPTLTVSELATWSAVRALLVSAGLSNADETPQATIERLGVELPDLRRLADDGRRYRGDLIEDAIKEGIRAHGNDFAVEVYRGMLGRASLDEIKRFRDDWTAVALTLLPGGRISQDQPQTDTAAPVKRIPDHAYAS